MKKIISLLLAFSILLCFALAGCDSELGIQEPSQKEDKKIALTLENYALYLTVTGSCFGKEGYYFSSKYVYDDIVSYATVSSAFAWGKYQFHECVVSVKVSGKNKQYLTYTEDETEQFSNIIRVELDESGRGQGEVWRSCLWAYDVSVTDFEVLAISGYVEPME